MMTRLLITVIYLAASALAQVPPGWTNVFSPSNLYIYDVSNGAISDLSPTALVFKSPTNGGRDKTTLLTFKYPAGTNGKQCQLFFNFDQAADATSRWDGSGRLDIFSSNSVAPGKTSGWPPGNQRNNHLGRWKKSATPWADWEATYGGLSVPQPCKPPGTVQGFEIVGVYDNTYVTYTNALSGVRIAYR
ncbi:uncharacterized protein G6M90_00g054170 [Metarhizium brunneum]|uniref:Ubiquitin 3 binding protein But2 C-terminal domain-containing protein n=1 Tax=Metarhizium brunneum TaxID=500148 RepID=A0A7D5Z682_9HYPO